MHDVIEDADITKDDIEEEFGKEVALLVKTNTKNEDLENKYEDLIERCALAGESALIIKAADILDNFNYYTRINDGGGRDYVKMIYQLLLNQKPDEFKDPIFEELRIIK